MTREDINNIISVICPNDEDFEKSIISPKYLKEELEQLALEQEPCEDCINRADIQDYIANFLSQYLYNDVREAIEDIDAYIGDMPSVKPKTDILDKIRNEITNIKTLEQEPSEDCISRQALMDCYGKWQPLSHPTRLRAFEKELKEISKENTHGESKKDGKRGIT